MIIPIESTKQKCPIHIQVDSDDCELLEEVRKKAIDLLWCGVNDGSKGTISHVKNTLFQGVKCIHICPNKDESLEMMDRFRLFRAWLCAKSFNGNRRQLQYFWV